MSPLKAATPAASATDGARWSKTSECPSQTRFFLMTSGSAIARSGWQPTKRSPSGCTLRLAGSCSLIDSPAGSRRLGRRGSSDPRRRAGRRLTHHAVATYDQFTPRASVHYAFTPVSQSRGTTTPTVALYTEPLMSARQNSFPYPKYAGDLRAILTVSVATRSGRLGPLDRQEPANAKRRLCR